jgi:hypothetical protein
VKIPKPSRKGIPRHHRLHFAFRANVAVYSYEVTVTGGEHGGTKRHSYEVYHAGVRKRRFLFIDCGDLNKDLAMAWAEGYALGVLDSTPEKP